MKTNQSSIVFLSSLTLLLLCMFITSSNAMANLPSSSEKAEVQIVYTRRPENGVDPKTFHIETLTSVLGSEKAAKESLLYVYQYAAFGFAAVLTPHQVAELSKKPYVLYIAPNRGLGVYSLDVEQNI